MRSLLVIPGADPAAIAAGWASGADALLLDVAGAALAPGGQGPALYLRLPPLDDQEALSVLEQAAQLPLCGVALSDAQGGADVQRLGARLAVREAATGRPEGDIRILAFATESPQSIFGLSSYRGASPRLEGLIWTPSPLDKALRGAPGRLGEPLRLARNLCLIAARAAGVLALDAACEGDDAEVLRAEAQASRDDGFDGKVALSLDQVGVLNAVFTR